MSDPATTNRRYFATSTIWTTRNYNLPAKREFKWIEPNTAENKDENNKLEPPNSSRNAFQPQLQFVEGLKKKTARQVSRSHVTKQHYLRKRHEARKARQRIQHTRIQYGLPDDEISRLNEGRSWNEQGIYAFQGRKEDDELVVNPRDLSFTLLDFLGGGRTDPFNSYPVAGTREIHELVDHFYFVIPSLVYRHWSQAVKKPRSCWDLLNLYRQSQVSFLGMLHHAAVSLAKMKGSDGTNQVIRFKNMALDAAKDSITHSQSPYDDGTIIAVGLLANAARLMEETETAKMHWGALKRMILDRGGFPGMKSNLILHTKLLWSFIALSWPTNNGNPAYVDTFVEIVAQEPNIAGAGQKPPFWRSCDEFIQFMEHRRMQVLRSNSSSNRDTMLSIPSRINIFRDQSKIWAALQTFETGYISADKRKAVDNCRMACLIFLNLVIADHGECSALTEQFFSRVRKIIEAEDDDSSLSAEHLLWTLLGVPILEDHFERTWKLSRLIGVAKKSSSTSWTTIEESLRSFLILSAAEKGLIFSNRNHSEPELFGVRIRSVESFDLDLDATAEFSQEFAHNKLQNFTCSSDCAICGLCPPGF